MKTKSKKKSVNKARPGRVTLIPAPSKGALAIIAEGWKADGEKLLRLAISDPLTFLKKTVPIARNWSDNWKTTQKVAGLEWDNRFKSPITAALKALEPENKDTILFEVDDSKASLERPKTTVVSNEAPVAIEALVIAGLISASELLTLVKDVLPSIDPARTGSFVEAKIRTLSEADALRYAPRAAMSEVKSLGERLKIGAAAKNARK